MNEIYSINGREFSESELIDVLEELFTDEDTSDIEFLNE